MSNSVTIREIQPSDLSDLLLIRNDPENYKWFTNNRKVSYIEHNLWFNQRLKMDRRLTLIAELNNKAVGIAYLNNTLNHRIFVSINIAKDYHSLGIGSKLINAIAMNCENLQGKYLLAKVHRENNNSKNFFEKNGFNLVEKKKLEKKFQKSNFDIYKKKLK